MISLEFINAVAKEKACLLSSLLPCWKAVAAHEQQ
jgi:hypothetical protein